MLPPLLAVLLLLPSASPQSGKDCGDIILEQRKKQDCVQASKVQLIGARVVETVGNETGQKYAYHTLAILNGLQIIRSDDVDVSGNHFSSLRIEDTESLVYTPETFLPNLTAIIPHPKAKSSVIMIRNNSKLCLPDSFRSKLLSMVPRGQAFIQKCHCRTKNIMSTHFSKALNRIWDLPYTVDVEGGDDCRVLTGDLVFTEENTDFLTEEIRRKLANVEEIRGHLVVSDSNFTSLEFLKNLKKIQAPDNFATKFERRFDNPVTIIKNAKLEKLGFLLDQINAVGANDDVLMVVAANPKLKLTMNEQAYYENFIISQYDSRPIPLNYNKTLDNPLRNPLSIMLHRCQMKDSPLKHRESIEECTHIEGDLVLNQEYNKLDKWKLESLLGHTREMKGCLTIEQSEWKSIDFLHSLATVNCLKDRPAIIVQNNPFLEHLDLQIFHFEDRHLFVTKVSDDDDNQTMGDGVAWRIVNNPRLCRTEVEHLMQLLKARSKLRRIEYDGWNRECFDLKKEYPDYAWFYYIVAAGIILVGNGIAEVVLRASRRAARRRRMEF